MINSALAVKKLINTPESTIHIEQHLLSLDPDFIQKYNSWFISYGDIFKAGTELFSIHQL